MADHVLSFCSSFATLPSLVDLPSRRCSTTASQADQSKVDRTVFDKAARLAILPLSLSTATSSSASKRWVLSMSCSLCCCRPVALVADQPSFLNLHRLNIAPDRIAHYIRSPLPQLASIAEGLATQLNVRHDNGEPSPKRAKMDGTPVPPPGGAVPKLSLQQQQQLALRQVQQGNRGPMQVCPHFFQTCAPPSHLRWS